MEGICLQQSLSSKSENPAGISALQILDSSIACASPLTVGSGQPPLLLAIYIYIHIHIHTYTHMYRACGISSILYLASKPLINLDAHPGSIYVHILPDHQISNLSQCSNVQNLTLEAPSCNLVYNPHELFTRNPEFAALESNFDNDLGHDIVI